MHCSCLSLLFVGYLATQIGSCSAFRYTGNGGPAYYVLGRQDISVLPIGGNLGLRTTDETLLIRFRRSVNDTGSSTLADDPESSSSSPSFSPNDWNTTKAMILTVSTTTSSPETLSNRTTAITASSVNSTRNGFSPASVSGSVSFDRNHTNTTAITNAPRASALLTTSASRSSKSAGINVTSYSAPFGASVTTSTTARTVIAQDPRNRKYYEFRFLFAKNATAYWTNAIDDILDVTPPNGVRQSDQLSATTVELSFPFLFYGHEVTQVTIATGGFLYMSDFLYERLTFSQYIAPLMANFDFLRSNGSRIRYLDNGTAFTVWWHNVYLADLFSGKPFSFQVILYNTSEIAFVYDSVPIPIKSIPSSVVHPVKVGLSDAYYFDQTFFNGLVERTISVYSRIDVDFTFITDQTAVIIKPLPTCIVQRTCQNCLNATNYTPFNCQWCPTLRRCSDGLDRMRQTWLKYGCTTNQRVTVNDSCPYFVNPANSDHKFTRLNPSAAVGVILVTLALAIFLALVTWSVYAITNPESPSGQCFIRYRPRAVLDRLRRSESCRCCITRSNDDVSSYVTFHSDLDSTRA